MKVLLINSVCGVGSTGRICTDIYDELVKQGHECCVAYGRGTAAANYETYKVGNQLAICIHGIEARIFDNEGFTKTSINVTKKFLKFIDQYAPDVVNIHNLHGYYLNIEVLLKYLNEKKIKTIVTLHDGWLFSPHEAYPQFTSDGHIIFSKKQRKIYPNSFFYRGWRNLSRKKEIWEKFNLDNLSFISPSNWLKKEAQKSIIKKFEIKVINNGINLELFNKKNVKRDNVILAVADIWTERKGLFYINELSKIISPHYKIIVVGKVKLEDKISEITYIDRTSTYEELIDIYHRAKIFINPTLADNFPTVNMEAIASGVPVITFETGGSPEVVLANTGIVCQQKSADCLNNAIKTIESSNINWEKSCLIESKSFSKKIFSQKYVNEYFRIINQKN